MKMRLLNIFAACLLLPSLTFAEAIPKILNDLVGRKEPQIFAMSLDDLKKKLPGLVCQKAKSGCPECHLKEAGAELKFQENTCALREIALENISEATSKALQTQLGPPKTLRVFNKFVQIAECSQGEEMLIWNSNNSYSIATHVYFRNYAKKNYPIYFFSKPYADHLNRVSEIFYDLSKNPPPVEKVWELLSQKTEKLFKDLKITPLTESQLKYNTVKNEIESAEKEKNAERASCILYSLDSAITKANFESPRKRETLAELKPLKFTYDRFEWYQHDLAIKAAKIYPKTTCGKISKLLVIKSTEVDAFVNDESTDDNMKVLALQKGLHESEMPLLKWASWVASLKTPMKEWGAAAEAALRLGGDIPRSLCPNE